MLRGNGGCHPVGYIVGHFVVCCHLFNGGVVFCVLVVRCWCMDECDGGGGRNAKACGLSMSEGSFVAQGGFEEAALLLVFWKYALYRVHGGLRI